MASLFHLSTGESGTFKSTLSRSVNIMAGGAFCGNDIFRLVAVREDQRMTSHFLFATVPLISHVNQALTLVKVLVERGNTVTWLTGEGFRPTVEAAGARFSPLPQHIDFSVNPPEKLFPGHRNLHGLSRLKFELKHFYIQSALAQVKALEQLCRIDKVDLLVSERAFVGVSAFHELGGPPFASYSIAILPFLSNETAPVGLGLRPNASFFGKLRNRALNSLCKDLLFKDVTNFMNQERKKLGLGPATASFFEQGISPYLYLQGTAPIFEYPRSNLPRQIHFVGPFLPEEPHRWTPPDWWEKLRDTGKKVIHVTQGTVATNPQDLLFPTLEAIHDEGYTVVATCKGVDRNLLGRRSSSHDVFTAEFIPHYHLLMSI